MAGRPRKPSPIRVLEGNPARRPIPPDLESPDVADPSQYPDWLISPRAQGFWLEMAPLLASIRVLTETDRHALALWCAAMDRYLDNPSKDNTAVVLRLLTELGMTPASRSKVVPTPKQTPGSVWDEIDALGKAN